MSQTRPHSLYEYYAISGAASPIGSDGLPNLWIYRSAVATDQKTRNYTYATSTEKTGMPTISAYNDLSKYIVIHTGSSVPSASSITMVDPAVYPAAYVTGNDSNASVLTNDGLLYCYNAADGKAYLYDLLKIEYKAKISQFNVYKFTFNEPNITESSRLIGATTDDINGQRIPVQLDSDGYLSYTRVGMYKIGDYTYYGSPTFESDEIDDDIADSLGYYKTSSFTPQSSEFSTPWKQFVMIISDQPLLIEHLAASGYKNSLATSSAVTGTGIYIETNDDKSPYWYMLNVNQKAHINSTGDALPIKQTDPNGISYMTFKLKPAATSAVPTYVRII